MKKEAFDEPTGIKSMSIEVKASEMPGARVEYLGIREVTALARAVKDRIDAEMDEGATPFESAESLMIAFYSMEMLIRALSEATPEGFLPPDIRDFYLGNKTIDVWPIPGGRGSLDWKDR
jgi:hypothetical protein